jgi:hypothetical protein
LHQYSVSGLDGSGYFPYFSVKDAYNSPVYDHPQMDCRRNMLLFVRSRLHPHCQNDCWGETSIRTRHSNPAQMGIPLAYWRIPRFTLDTTYAALIQDKAADQLSLKAYSQPILILSFVEGKVVSLNNNCSFPGLPRIHWNIFGTFNQFPPSSFFQDSTIQILQFSELAKTLVPLNEKAINQPNFKDTLMVVMVSKTYGRQSNGLIQTIRTQYPNQTDKILFVNNDFYIYHKLNTGFN